jgi:16S rRNA (cytosine967-C5)-methyltransferase
VTGPPRPGQKPRPRRSKPRPDVPRRVAFDLLRAVAERDAYANLTLPALLRERALGTRDAAFATELGYGTLRGRGTYDAVLAACVDRPLDQVDPPVLDLLRLGTHQLLAMRVPSHAAVGATVELARAVAGEGRGSFVNAVLRRVGRRDLRAWLVEVAPPYDTDPVGNLAVAHSHPRWVVSALRDALGGALAETAALLAADNAAPQVTLVARPGRATVAELVEAGAAPGRWSPYAAVLPGGDPGAIPAVRDGRAGVQDEGSQLVALALADVPLDGPDNRWLDLAAGPGGKAALLGAVAAGRGAAVLAAEVAAHRAQLVGRVVGGTATVVVADGRVPAWQQGAFDRVLVDAPCTGLGSLRRRPESRWRRQPSDLPPLTKLQRELLGAALRAVRVGGVVAYVTCSPHPAETTVTVREAIRRCESTVEQFDAREYLPGAVPGLGAGPSVQLWPHRHGTDAMFLALLRRTA